MQRRIIRDGTIVKTRISGMRLQRIFVLRSRGDIGIVVSIVFRNLSFAVFTGFVSWRDHAASAVNS